jgi:hypothetical protein
MEEIDAERRRSRGLITRRAVLGGIAAGAVSPLLWSQPGFAANPPAGIHLEVGADPLTEMTVSWSTAGSVMAPVVDVGTTAAYGRTVAADGLAVADTTSVYHHARLSGLEPDTTYHYRVRHTGGASPDLTFRTAPADPRATFRYTAFGDQGTTSDSAKTVAVIGAAKPALHVHVGDLCYADSTGDGKSTDTYTPAIWDEWFAQNQAVQRSIPWMPTVGNHEMEPGFGPEGYDGFNARFALPGNGVSGSKNTYWFRYGNVAFVACDGNDVSYEIIADRGWLGGRQQTWLAATLAMLRADASIDFIVAGFHNCAYCTNLAHGSDGGIRAELLPIFDTYGVDLVVNGHNHCYERTNPLKGGKTTATAPTGSTVTPASQGTTYICAGGGGQSNSIYQFLPAGTGYVSAQPNPTGSVPDIDVEPEVIDWSAVRSTDYSLIVVDVTPLTASRTATMHIRAVSEDGTVIDDVTLERPAKAGLRAVGTTPSTTTVATPATSPAGTAEGSHAGGSGDLAFTGLGTAVPIAALGLAATGAAAWALGRRGSEES